MAAQKGPLGKKSSRSAFGAPSQHTQSSRKGKRSWRKNVNIEDVEQGLESIRTEERVTGVAIQKTRDIDLFEVDLKGDDNVRKSLPRFSPAQLTSAKILAQRSAVPAIFSRTLTSRKRKPIVSQEDKERLLRISKRPRKGPFNSVLDPTEYAAGSTIVGLSAAVRKSGTYDPWDAEPQSTEVKDGLETVQNKVAKAPQLTKTRDFIKVPAVTEPHQGTSYNPPADAHRELLLRAATVEKKRLLDLEKMAEVKAKIDAARYTADVGETSFAAGMTVQEIDDHEEEEPVDRSSFKTKVINTKKSRSQRNKEKRLRGEKQALLERIQRRRLLAAVGDAKSIRQTTAHVMQEREQIKEKKRLTLAKKLEEQGLSGQKLGKHTVPVSDIEVQLGENLSESLRGLKTEGSLFRDRFQSLQQRALLEPRLRVLPTKRKTRFVEYEKHSWKRFE